MLEVLGILSLGAGELGLEKVSTFGSVVYGIMDTKYYGANYFKHSLSAHKSTEIN